MIESVAKPKEVTSPLPVEFEPLGGLPDTLGKPVEGRVHPFEVARRGKRFLH